MTAPGAEAKRILDLRPGEPEYRILIVDDERENRMVMERLLLNAGFLVRVVLDGAQAVELFGCWRPHFIWMDLRMPAMDGVEAVRHIRALAGGRDVKIAAVSASVFAGQQGEVLAAGLDDFVRKPYRPGDIFDCLARHLGVRYRYLDARPASREEPAAALPTGSVRDASGGVASGATRRPGCAAGRAHCGDDRPRAGAGFRPRGRPGALCRPVGLYGDLPGTGRRPGKIDGRISAQLAQRGAPGRRHECRRGTQESACATR